MKLAVFSYLSLILVALVITNPDPSLGGIVSVPRVAQTNVKGGLVLCSRGITYLKKAECSESRDFYQFMYKKAESHKSELLVFYTDNSPMCKDDANAKDDKVTEYTISSETSQLKQICTYDHDDNTGFDVHAESTPFLLFWFYRWLKLAMLVTALYAVSAL